MKYELCLTIPNTSTITIHFSSSYSSIIIDYNFGEIHYLQYDAVVNYC